MATQPLTRYGALASGLIITSYTTPRDTTLRDPLWALHSLASVIAFTAARTESCP